MVGTMHHLTDMHNPNHYGRWFLTLSINHRSHHGEVEDL